MSTPLPGERRDLQDKVVLVTGGGGGIGHAVSTTLLAAGARVVSVDLPGRSGAKGTTSLECDLANSAAVTELFGLLRDRFGRVDVLVHAAGVTRDGISWKMSDEAWRTVLSVNLDSAFWLSREAIPMMRANGSGAMVLISSINGQRGKIGQANYAASKAGLIGFARTLARETGRFGIRVNVVAPGFIETEMTATLPEESRQAALAETALGRVGRPEDVADAVLFLASSMSRHVTGQVLRVDGGQLIA